MILYKLAGLAPYLRKYAAMGREMVSFPNLKAYLRLRNHCRKEAARGSHTGVLGLGNHGGSTRCEDSANPNCWVYSTSLAYGQQSNWSMQPICSNWLGIPAVLERLFEFSLSVFCLILLDLPAPLIFLVAFLALHRLTIMKNQCTYLVRE